MSIFRKEREVITNATEAVKDHSKTLAIVAGVAVALAAVALIVTVIK